MKKKTISQKQWLILQELFYNTDINLRRELCLKQGGIVYQIIDTEHVIHYMTIPRLLIPDFLPQPKWSKGSEYFIPGDIQISKVYVRADR